MKDTIPFWNWFKANYQRYKNIHEHNMDTINDLLDVLIAELTNDELHVIKIKKTNN